MWLPNLQSGITCPMQWDGGATLTLAVEIFLGKPPKMSTNLQAPIFNTFFFNTSHQHWDGGKPAAVKPKFANFFLVFYQHYYPGYGSSWSENVINSYHIMYNFGYSKHL